MTEKKTLRGDRNQCPSCGEYFNSTHAFEKHRAGDFATGRRCLDTYEMTAKGMIVGSDGFWRGSARPAETIGAAE
jgi:hypothetical protein